MALFRKEYFMIFLALAFVAALSPFRGTAYSDLINASHDQKSISDFIEAAFSDVVWEQSEYQERHAGLFPKLFGHSEANYWLGLIEDETPWIAPFVGRMGEDLPKKNVIHKWSGDISIGFDTPPYGEKCVAQTAEKYCVNRYSYTGAGNEFTGDPMYVTLEKQIASLIPDLEEATGRRVRFIPNNTAEEKSAQHAKIRILWMRGNAQKNYFKSYYRACNSESCSVSAAAWFSKIREYLWGALPFTPDARSQVDGYILPYSNDSIGMSFCNINPLVGVDLVKSLVTECIVRSLGFPGIVDDEKAVLGRWNKKYDQYSRVAGVDKDGYLPRGDRYFSVNKFPKDLAGEGGLMLSLTRRDKELVRMLYCDAIKSGM
ncbi:MAG TPA: hypothetical protein VHP34_10375, partial [Alphaproteobacteria bacterium]|nr:hypothetical protein [Alphaproteobacteria bacterium]